MLYILLYFVDLAAFWGTVILTINWLSGKLSVAFPILSFVAFIALTLILIYHEFKIACDYDKLVGDYSKVFKPDKDTDKDNADMTENRIIEVIISQDDPVLDLIETPPSDEDAP